MNNFLIALDDWFHDYRDVFILVIALALLIGMALYGSLELNKKICSVKAEQMQMESHWGFWEGCMIEVQPGKWIPLDSYYYKEEK